GDEPRRRPFGRGDGGGEIGAPHEVGLRGGDRAVVRAWPERTLRARWRQEAILPHQPQHPHLRCPHALETKLRPHLAMTLADEIGLRQNIADPRDELAFAILGMRTSLARRIAATLGALLPSVVRRSRQAELLGHHRHAVAMLGAGRLGAAHSLDLPDPKGSTPCNRQRSRKSSLRIVSSPSIALSRRISSSSAVVVRLFHFAYTPAT